MCRHIPFLVKIGQFTFRRVWVAERIPKHTQTEWRHRECTGHYWHCHWYSYGELTEWWHRECIGHCMHCHWHGYGVDWTEWWHRECTGHCMHCHWYSYGDEWTEWRHQNCYSAHCLHISIVLFSRGVQYCWEPSGRAYSLLTELFA